MCFLTGLQCILCEWHTSLSNTDHSSDGPNVDRKWSHRCSIQSKNGYFEAGYGLQAIFIFNHPVQAIYIKYGHVIGGEFCNITNHNGPNR